MNTKISLINNSLVKIFISSKTEINAIAFRIYNLGCDYMDVRQYYKKQQ